MKKISMILILALWLINAHSQEISPEILSSAGNTFTGTEMNIDWTLGEIAINKVQNSANQITQGFHQPTSQL